jgi:hypothetical protein
VVLIAQEEAFEPSHLIISVARGNQLIIMKHDLKEVQMQIPECLELRKRAVQSLDEVYAQYRVSQDAEVLEPLRERWEADYKKHEKCYLENVTLQPFFTKIKDLAGAITGVLSK